MCLCCLTRLGLHCKVYALASLGKATNLMDALFGLELEEEFKCEESGESKVSSATAKKLVCNIQGGAGASTQVRHGLRRTVLCCVASASVVGGGGGLGRGVGVGCWCRRCCRFLSAHVQQ